MPATVNRRLARLTPAAIHSQGKNRPVILEIYPFGNGAGKPGPNFLGFRLKGTKRTYYLPVDWCYREAVRGELARQKAERRKAKQQQNS